MMNAFQSFWLQISNLPLMTAQEKLEEIILTQLRY